MVRSALRALIVSREFSLCPANFSIAIRPFLYNNRQERLSQGDGNVKDVLTLILAGGKGTRLEPLTRDRAKPAVPFGGLYRIIDFPLSNCLNSALRRVLVLTQYKARSLDRHLARGWGFLSRELDEYIEV